LGEKKNTRKEKIVSYKYLEKNIFFLVLMTCPDKEGEGDGKNI
jgi:hypothetical protein